MLLTQLQEIANPKTSSLLSYYPEDGGARVSEAKHGHKWLYEVPIELASPSLRYGHQLFFTLEPVLLLDRRVCMPFRWFTRKDSDGTEAPWAHCWTMIPQTDASGKQFWRVDNSSPFDVCVYEMVMTFPELVDAVEDHSTEYPYPSPTDIRGMIPPFIHCITSSLMKVLSELYDHERQALRAWTLTDPKNGNRWRTTGMGYRVVSFPIWLYCDDTSGNTSKKWNAHNSFLFTPAGLPLSESQKEYHVQFLCTSNIAAPLEMLDGVLEQLRCVSHALTSLALTHLQSQP